MAWTTADRDALKKAIAQGAQRVRFADRDVEYRSLEEMRQVLAMIDADINTAAGVRRVRQVRFYTGGGF
jgi:hypothetical protein